VRVRPASRRRRADRSRLFRSSFTVALDRPEVTLMAGINASGPAERVGLNTGDVVRKLYTLVHGFAVGALGSAGAPAWTTVSLVREVRGNVAMPAGIHKPAQRRPKNPRMSRTMTTAPTSQMIRFMVDSLIRAEAATKCRRVDVVLGSHLDTAWPAIFTLSRPVARIGALPDTDSRH